MHKLATFLLSLTLVALVVLAAWAFVIAPTVEAIGTSLPF